MKVEFVSLFPALRFPGFEAQSEVFELGKITKVIDCKHRTPEYVEEGVPIVSPGSIKWGEIDLVSPTKRVTEEDYESLMDHCEPSVDDLVLSRNQSLGIASHITSNEKFVLGQDTVLIKQKNGNGMLIFHRLQTSGTQNIISRLSGGSTFSRINLKDIRLLPLPLPTEEREQRKIADFLTAVDGRIGQLIQKRALLEDYKKGVMQQIFTQAIRFKDDHGNDFPDWEEKKLGELGKFTGGGTPETGDDSYWSGNIPWVSSSDISESSITKINKHRFITQAAIGGSATKLVPANSILFISRVGVGKLAVCTQEVCTSQDFTNFTPLKDHLKYLGYYFTFNQNLLKRYAQGTSIKGITSQELKKIAVGRPSLHEQTKIADFLSAIDRKIESVATQITQTQTFKRGLLQQMFV